MNNLPLAYRIKQQGITVIEASAGTGKTFTLIRLIARHILWYNKKIEQILAVTFTEAATAELRIRLRDFLHDVEKFYHHPTDDEDIEFLFTEAPPEISEAELYLRLTAAIGNVDKASIFTIHGFCQRTLNEQPLLTGQSIPGPTFLDNQSILIEQICFEFWRNIGQESDYAEALQNTWSSPEQMLFMANELLSNAVLKPDRPEKLIIADFTVAFNKFKTTFLLHRDEAQRLLLLAIDNKSHNGVSHKANKTIAQFSAIESFINSPTINTALDLSQIARSKFKPSKNGTSPTNPLFEAADEWLVYKEQQQQYLYDLSLCLIHDFRLFLRERLAALKKQSNVISFDDLIDQLHTSLTDTQGSELAALMRQAYPVALVDEFQDTDDRQWAIFKEIYAQHESVCLTLIGDPKQAIYAFRGGDIHAYLHARNEAQHVESLSDNYRSSAEMVNAVYRLFTHKSEHPFYEPNIDLIPVQAKSKVGELIIRGLKSTALQILPIAPTEFEKPQNKSTATLYCAQQCAQQIAQLSQDISQQQALIKINENVSRLLNFHDIAVLVATNKQAKLMQNSLSDAGVASVCVEKSSVFDNYEAIDVLNLLLYLQTPSGRQQQQNAYHGVILQCLLGEGSLSAFELTYYQDLWHKHGVLACFNALLNQTESAILALNSGERRLSNYWQIIELLQIQSSQSTEHAEIIDWLSIQIESSKLGTLENSNQTPRLESGADRIRILTLHQSKGLEFGIVFMPFTAINKSTSKFKNKLLRYYDGQQRCLYYQQSTLEQSLAERIQQEQDSENLRVLYVGATRAKFALTLSYGAVRDIEGCALTRVLLRDDKISAESIQKAIQAFPNIQSVPLIPISKSQALDIIEPSYLDNTRILDDVWRISSFSGLHQSKEQHFSNPASDEYHPMLTNDPTPFKGAAFGNALHYVLEHANTLDWSTSVPNQTNQSAQLLALTGLIQFGYESSTAEQGVATLCALVFNTLHGLLPENISLFQISEKHKRHELEFHLSLDSADCNKILNIMHNHHYCLNRVQFGFQQQLNGLLTGKIDLIYCHQNIFYIVDYKSNLLSDYQTSSLANSIKSQEYDLQYLLYCIALHRYLKHKIGHAYHYDKHFGGVRYLYSRGMQAGHTTGIFCDRPEFTLIHQLDLCFDSHLRNIHVA